MHASLPIRYLHFLTPFLWITLAFSQNEDWCPTYQRCSSIDQNKYKLTDDPNKPWENGALSFCMPGYSNKCERDKIACARNNARSPGGCLGADPATNFVSELEKLDELKVARMSIGVGGGSETTHGSALWMIDNSPNKNTIDPAQVFDNDALVTAVTSVNVCAEVANLTPSPTKNPSPAPTKNPTPSPTKNPTPGPTDKPTPGPTPSPTKSPTPQPTPQPSTNAPISIGGFPSGYTPLGGPSATTVGVSQPSGGNPLVIGEQTCVDVGFGLTNTWGTSIDYIFVQYKDLKTGLQVCEAFKNVTTSWFVEFSAKCRHHAPISIVTITAVDSSFSTGDTAALLDCCGDNEILGEISGTAQKVVTSTYVLDCCPEE
jgi:hypothetical protein